MAASGNEWLLLLFILGFVNEILNVWFGKEIPKIAESVKDKSESEVSQIRQAFREALYAKGNPMPSGYKPLLDAAEYAFDAAIAKGKVKLPSV